MIPKSHPLPNGLVIVFEGIDGVGKTTQLEMTHKALESAGWPVMATRNMGGTPIGEALREVMKSSLERPPLTDFYLSLAVQEPLIEVIDSARAEGKIVLMDRGPLSLAAYQIYGSGVDESFGWPHVEDGINRIKPSAVILYDTDPETALGRLSQHSAKTDYFESKPVDYFDRVAMGFRGAAKRYPYVETIDAAQSIDAVHTQTMAVIEQVIKEQG